MAVLLLRTFRTPQRDPILLLTAKEARETLYCILIQSVVRGYLARRWFRLIFKFVVDGLGTTFVVERARALQSSRQPFPQYLITPGCTQTRSIKRMSEILEHSGFLTERIVDQAAMQETSEQTRNPEGGLTCAEGERLELEVEGTMPAFGSRSGTMFATIDVDLIS